MEILVNGESRQIDSGTTVLALLAELELAEKRLAVEINREILPRSEYPNYEFQEGDQIEIVHAIGGGDLSKR